MEVEGKPIAQLSPHDLYALSTILQFYERYLWEMAAPSAKCSKQIAAIQLLIVKIFQLPISQAMVLTFDEVEYINTAIRVFMSQIRKEIPCSARRDGILECCEQLQEYIATVFTSKRS